MSVDNTVLVGHKDFRLPGDELLHLFVHLPAHLTHPLLLLGLTAKLFEFHLLSLFPEEPPAPPEGHTGNGEHIKEYHLVQKHKL